MTAPLRLAPRKAARRPTPRTVTAELAGEFEGWTATMRVDWPAGWMAAIESGELGAIMRVLDAAITSHNMPDAEDGIAATMADVDPAEGMAKMAAALFDQMSTLPPR